MKKPDGGYIKLERKILDWRWSRDPNTFSVFVHLLMMANYKDGDFEGMTVRRGSLVTSYESLGKSCGLKYSQSRTALTHLKLTGEITITRRPRCLVITIVNYDQYQSHDNQIAIKSQSNRNHEHNQIATRERIYKESKEGKKRARAREEPPSGETEVLPSERSPDDYPFRSGWRKKPEWMSADVWERDKDMTVDMIPSAYRGQYDNVQEYLHDRETGALRG